MIQEMVVRLADEFSLSEQEVLFLIKTAPFRYKVHEIDKRNGRGTRLIAQPTSDIKTLQRWLIKNYLEFLPVHPAATAYRHGRSIRDHAKLHARNSYLLKLDFKDFFPSILGTDFLKHIDRYASALRGEAELMVRLLFWAGKPRRELHLSIGAPSSPVISNSIMYLFDSALEEYCERIDATYTRYADDIAISTNRPHVLDEALGYVKDLSRNVAYPRLTLNDAKTVFTSKKRQRQLTGLILTNDGTVSLGREKKRLIRAMAYRYSQNELCYEEVQHLRGLLAYAVSIEPHFLETIRRMIGQSALTNIQRGSPSTE